MIGPVLFAPYQKARSGTKPPSAFSVALLLAGIFIPTTATALLIGWYIIR